MRHLLAALSATASAATTSENAAKYQALRQRLNTELIIVGDAPGMSQPADERIEPNQLGKPARATHQVQATVLELTAAQALSDNREVSSSIESCTPRSGAQPGSWQAPVLGFFW